MTMIIQVLSTHSFPLHSDNIPYYIHFREVESESQKGYVFSSGSHVCVVVLAATLKESPASKPKLFSITLIALMGERNPCAFLQLARRGSKYSFPREKLLLRAFCDER